MVRAKGEHERVRRKDLNLSFKQSLYTIIIKKLQIH